MTIKKLPKKDFEQAKQLYCECFQKEKKPTTIHSLGTYLALYEQNKLIGILQIDYLNNQFENTKIAYINNFCITPKYQHQGYGEALLKECLKYLKRKGINKVQMTSNKNRTYAHKIYQNQNFQKIDTIFLIKDLNDK